MKRLLILATLLTSVLALTACAAATESPPPTASPSPTATASVTPSPTATPSPTIPPPATKIPPTQTPQVIDIEMPPKPPYEETMLGDDFLSNGTDDSCQLPCWFNLRVGETSISEVEDFFNVQLGFETLSLAQNTDNPNSIIQARSTWGFEGIDGLHIRVRISKGTLIYYYVDWVGESKFGPYVQLYRFIDGLGNPQAVRLEIDENYIGFFSLLVSFDSDIEVSLDYFSEAQDDGTFIMCTDDPPLSGSIRAPARRLTEEYEETFVSFEEVFGSSLDSVDLSQPGVCLTGQFEPTSSDFE